MFPTPRMRLDMRSLTAIFTRPLNRGRGRRVQPGQKIHASVLKFMKEKPDYVPAAEFNKDLGLTWDQIKTWDEASLDSKASSIIVKDLYSSASDVIDALSTILTRPERDITRRDTDVLVQIASSCQ